MQKQLVYQKSSMQKRDGFKSFFYLRQQSIFKDWHFSCAASSGHTGKTTYLPDGRWSFVCLSGVFHVWMLFVSVSCCFAVPLVSRVCPSDVCRIWKSGASLRVDVTLLGFENMTWIRGRRSYIFRGDGMCLHSLTQTSFLCCCFD